MTVPSLAVAGAPGVGAAGGRGALLGVAGDDVAPEDEPVWPGTAPTASASAIDWQPADQACWSGVDSDDAVPADGAGGVDAADGAAAEGAVAGGVASGGPTGFGVVSRLV